MDDLKLQMWIRGGTAGDKIALYRTITGAEFVKIVEVVMSADGKRPWELCEQEVAVS